MNKLAHILLGLLIVFSAIVFSDKGIQVIQTEPLWIIPGVIYSLVLHYYFYKNTVITSGSPTKFIKWLENSVLVYIVILFLVIVGIVDFIGFAYAIWHGEIGGSSSNGGAGGDSILIIFISTMLIESVLEKKENKLNFGDPIGI